jgi:Nucleoside 2-deoxyribosyltransferase like
MPIIIKPPTYITYNKIPTVFLGGPIQGAWDWRAEVIDFFMNSGLNLYIASPKRDELIKGDFSQEKFNEQVDWESYHLKKAAKCGVILFWLAKETIHDCSRAYAQIVKYCNHKNDTKLVVGIEAGFSGSRYIRRRMGQDCKRLVIHDSLQKTIQAALLEVKTVISRKKL